MAPSKVEAIRSALGGLRSVVGIHGSALLARDGLVVVSDLPPNASQDVFIAMMAAAMAAGESGLHEIGRGTAERVIVENSNSRVWVQGVDAEHLLVVVVAATAAREALQSALAKMQQGLRGLLEGA